MASEKIKRLRKSAIILFLAICSSVIICGLISSASQNPQKLITLNSIFTIKVPPTFTCSEAEYALSDEVTQHYVIIGTNEYKNITGFIEVRNQASTLSEYLKQAENTFSASVYAYEKKPVLQNGNTGFDITFKINNIDHDTEIMQTIWQRDNKLYIISISAPIENNSKKKLEEAFFKLKSSVTLTGDSLPSGKLIEYCIQNI